MPTGQHSKPLSFKALDNMKSGQTMSDTGENRGLRITCGNGGTKTFFYRYRSPHTGKLVQTPIGYFPDVSLAEARVRLHELKSIRRDGRCPATELREERKRRQAPIICVQGFTVTDLVELYLQDYIEDRRMNGRLVPGARKRKGQDETRRTLYGDPVRVLGERAASEVSRQEIVDLVMDIVHRGASVQAGNVLRELTSAYEFAIGRGKFDDSFANPGVLAKSSLKRMNVRLTSQKGKRNLSDQELTKFLAWLPGSAFTSTQKNIFRMTLWTACRTGELCEVRWTDVDLEKGTLHIKESKTDAERYVQLPNQAIAFLRQLKLSTGDYLFPSQKTGRPIQQKSMTEQAWHLRKSNRMLDIAHWTPHDLRRTVRTGLARLRCPTVVAEAILGHSRSGIEGTYDLHTYEAEAKEWLQKWADYMDRLAEGAAEPS